MFDKVVEFEKNIAEFFGSPYAVATDSCTHALELCLRHTQHNNITVPTRTYISVPITLIKLGLQWNWKEEEWSDYYFLGNTNIIDAAVLWGENTYIPDTFMCLSFQFRKHLNLGRGGMILLQNKNDYDKLKKMSYDGRDLSYPSWGMQDINTIGYHYYMTPEVANDGIIKLNKIKNQFSKKWTYKDYPYLPNMTVFKQ
jgi:dTDP-4-amino-4,6-dideoxygalactose transaminase